MKTDSSRMKWSVGNTATTAAGSRVRIQCAASSTPAAVPRSQGWASTVIAGCPASSAATWAAWLAWVTATVREGGIRRATRSSVVRSRDVAPVSTTAQRSLLESNMV